MPLWLIAMALWPCNRVLLGHAGGWALVDADVFIGVSARKWFGDGVMCFMNVKNN
jgi:hypothetical protein